MAMAGLAAPSRAANISAIPATNGGPTIVLVRGDLTLGDDKAFANVALAHSSAVVLLNINGRLLLPNLEIGKAIRLKGFAMVVPEGFQCASDCALAWLAGTPRLVAKWASGLPRGLSGIRRRANADVDRAGLS